ncbi:MAG: small acid-soluble spore protein SspI [Bacilli bacterium]|nr:small acid-soluble spore protein SspI [Bacilli bacterium]
MDISIKEYIKNNFRNCTKEDLKHSIIESVNDQEEIVLPGLGVLFGILWNNSDPNLQNSILGILENNLKS